MQSLYGLSPCIETVHKDTTLCLIGLVVTIAFIFTNTLSEYLYGGQAMKLFWIHTGYRVVYILIIGAILGVWQ